MQVQVEKKAERAGDNQANPRGARNSQQDQTVVKAEHDHTDPAVIGQLTLVAVHVVENMLHKLGHFGSRERLVNQNGLADAQQDTHQEARSADADHTGKSRLQSAKASHHNQADFEKYAKSPETSSHRNFASTRQRKQRTSKLKSSRPTLLCHSHSGSDVKMARKPAEIQMRTWNPEDERRYQEPEGQRPKSSTQLKWDTKETTRVPKENNKGPGLRRPGTEVPRPHIPTNANCQREKAETEHQKPKAKTAMKKRRIPAINFEGEEEVEVLKSKRGCP